jgi:hypothetical protein
MPPDTHPRGVDVWHGSVKGMAAYVSGHKTADYLQHKIDAASANWHGALSTYAERGSKSSPGKMEEPHPWRRNLAVLFLRSSWRAMLLGACVLEQMPDWSRAATARNFGHTFKCVLNG